jgi:hypothetical protein
VPATMAPDVPGRMNRSSQVALSSRLTLACRPPKRFASAHLCVSATAPAGLSGRRLG